jgi:uncharacterized protein (DUF1810 family)
MTLERFKDAQRQPRAGFDAALAEIRGGRKQGHWIWYIFPQLAGLGGSPQSTFYGIADLTEAMDYLRDSVLRERLVSIAAAVEEHLRAGRSLATIMGSQIDALKIISSMTLFKAAAERLQSVAGDADYARLVNVAEQVLLAAEREGYRRCAFTLSRTSAR